MEPPRRVLLGNLRELAPWHYWRRYPSMPMKAYRDCYDPETFPCNGRMFEHYLHPRGKWTSNAYPERCCACDCLMDYYVSWGICRECTVKLWRMLAGQLENKQSLVECIFDFMEPTPVDLCIECDDSWHGWQCFICWSVVPEALPNT